MLLKNVLHRLSVKVDALYKINIILKEFVNQIVVLLDVLLQFNNGIKVMLLFAEID
jgi:hypothetical protein